MNINSTIMIGNITRDAEIRYLNDGTANVKFGIALNRRKKIGGEWKDEAMFFDVAMMGKAAEAVNQYLVKGKQVGIQGELRQDRWEKEGQKHSKVYVFADTLQLLGGNDNKQSKPKNSKSESQENFDDDIPW